MSDFSYWRGNPKKFLLLAIGLFLTFNNALVLGELTLVDVGSPGASSTVVTDVSGTTITTTARGLAAVSSQDEVAFLQQELRSTGTLEWTQGTLGSGQAGRCDGLMVRRSNDADSAMVYFGCQNDGTGAPKVVLSWRSTDGGSLASKIINDIPLRDSMGVLRLSLEWIRGKVVAKYFADSTDTWTPLYALDLAADSSGEMLGGFVRASGTSATSWGAMLASDAEAVEISYASAWSKVSEPSLADILPRATTLGVYATYAEPTPAATAPDRHWNVVSATGLTGGDQFACPVSTTEDASVTMQSLTSPATANEAVEVFARWGAPASGTAAVNVEVSVKEGSTEVASRVFDQNSDAGLWVYVGTAPAESVGHDLSVIWEVPMQAAATFSVDGMLLLTRGNDPDSDGDGLPDEWEKIFTFAGYPPSHDNDYALAHDDDGDGVSNLDEYEQGLDPSSGPGLNNDPLVVTPVLIGTDPSEATLNRRAPMDMVRSKPLQYKVTYPGSSTPVHGFPIVFAAGSVNAVAFGRTYGGHFTTGDLIVNTDAQGIATAYIKVVETSVDLPISAQLLTSSGDEFLIDSYVNNPPGPVDHTAANYSLGKVREVPQGGGKIAVSGQWMATCNNAAGPDQYGIVQLFQWESLTNNWRPTLNIMAPTGAGPTSGFGDLIALSGSTLAVYATGLEKVFIFELKTDTELWEHKQTLDTPTGVVVNSMALFGTSLALGVISEDRVYTFSKSTTWAADSPAYVEADAGDKADLEFGTCVAFSGGLIVGAPQAASAASTVHGEVTTYSRSGTTWASPLNITTPSGGETGRFGASVVMNSFYIHVGAPARAGVSPFVMGKVWTTTKLAGVWQTPWSFDGPSNDFGSAMWVGGPNRLIVAYRAQGTSSPGGFAFDRLNVYRFLTSSPSFDQIVTQEGDVAQHDDGSLFVTNPASVGGITELKFVPRVAYNAPAGTLVASLNYNNVDSDIDRVQLSQPWSLWSLSTSTSSGQLRVASPASLQPHAGSLQWFGIELQDLSAMKTNEILTVKITGQVPATPTSLAAAITSSGLPFLTWTHTLSPQVSLLLERANLPANTSPTGSESYTLVKVIAGTGSHAYDTTATILQDYAYRVRAESTEGGSGYSNVAVVHWDADSDGMPDWWEQANGGDLVASNDDDSDGITNLAEYTAKTNPNLVDTDGDGSPDDVDTFPLDGANNPLSLRVFTKLTSY